MPLIRQALGKGKTTKINNIGFYSEGKEEDEHDYLCNVIRAPGPVRKKPGELH